MMKTTSGDQPALKMVNPGAAAIDIGSTMHMAAVNPDSDDMPVRAFGTFTQNLHDLAKWFQSCGVTSVAMESTGVYWIPAFEILEQHGFEVILVNARYAKNVPAGRPTSAMLDGSGSFTPTACFGEASGLLRRLRPCGPICGNVSDWWNTPRPISSICKRP